MKEESSLNTTAINEKEKLLSFITDIYKSVIKKYNNIFNEEGYLPTKEHPSLGINGFTERNLTFNFCHSYLEENQNAIVWQEIPFNSDALKRQHVDSIIIDNDNKWVIYLEAKRLYGIHHFELLLDDFRRIKNHYSYIPLPKECHPTHKAVVLLADHYYQGECKGKMYKDNYYDNYFFGKDVIELPETSKKHSNLRGLIDSNKILNIIDDIDVNPITLCGKYNINIEDEIIYSIYCGIYFIDELEKE